MDPIKYVFVISNKFRSASTIQVLAICTHWEGEKVSPPKGTALRPHPNEQGSPNAYSQGRLPAPYIHFLGAIPPAETPRLGPDHSAARVPLPARLGDDHLGADLVEPLPELGALQLHLHLVPHLPALGAGLGPLLCGEEKAEGALGRLPGPLRDPPGLPRRYQPGSEALRLCLQPAPLSSSRPSGPFLLAERPTRASTEKA